ncbi:MAG: TetR/AcrR family transcriptional regulator [Alphaproteobacteria bacterium]
MSRSKVEPKADPKEDILRAAEHILGTSGVDAATVRAITGLAGVNTAAVNYHFGSRDDLFQVICGRRMQPANRAILDHLDALEVRPERPRVADIFRPLVETALTVWVQDDVLRALRSLLFLNPQTVESLNVSQMGEIYARMRGALRQACPEMAVQDVRRRFQLAMGTIMNTVHQEDAEFVWSHDEITVDDLVAFIAAGFGEADHGS